MERLDLFLLSLTVLSPHIDSSLFLARLGLLGLKGLQGLGVRLEGSSVLGIGLCLEFQSAGPFPYI